MPLASRAYLCEHPDTDLNALVERFPLLSPEDLAHDIEWNKRRLERLAAPPQPALIITDPGKRPEGRPQSELTRKLIAHILAHPGQSFDAARLAMAWGVSARDMRRTLRSVTQPGRPLAPVIRRIYGDFWQPRAPQSPQGP